MFNPEVTFGVVAHRECVRIAEEAADLIATEAPRGATGILADTMEAHSTTDGAEVTTHAHYWHFVEYGTGYMAAQRFVASAMEQLRAVYG